MRVPPGQSIEVATRRKFVTAAKSRLSALKDVRPVAIDRISTRDTLARLPDDTITADLVFAASGQWDTDAKWSKRMHQYDVAVAALERVLLGIEADFGDGNAA